MTNTSKERNDLFKNECKIINLKYEYEGYTGTEQWAIVSELTEKELFEFLIEFKIWRLRIFSYLALPRGIKYKSPFPSKGKDLIKLFLKLIRLHTVLGSLTFSSKSN